MVSGSHILRIVATAGTNERAVIRRRIYVGMYQFFLRLLITLGYVSLCLKFFIGVRYLGKVLFPIPCQLSM